MKYYSTNNPEKPVGLSDAILRSIAPDGGVYMPLSIPVIPPALFKNIADMSLTDIGYVVATSILGSDISPETINNIVKETLTFPIPLKKTGEHTYVLELFHGPTGSFKDVGARFMARIVEYLLNDRASGHSDINVFVATSGDTGCAVANGFAGIKGINVYIFHPKGRNLRVPKESFAATASNIHPICLRGSFDDCQRIVKEIYNDPELNSRMAITSANSINIARLLPQTFYYFHAYARLHEMEEKPGRFTVSTPCGNLGNLTAAIFACQLGLPIDKILAAGHDNERLWGVIQQGQLSVSDFNNRALSTNLARINTLIKKNPSIAEMIECHTYTDADISEQIRLTFEKSGYLMDRNTSMSCRALEQNMRPGETGIFFATADPAKYADRLAEILGPQNAPSPHKIADQLTDRPAEPVLPPLFPAVKRFLLDNSKH